MKPLSFILLILTYSCSSTETRVRHAEASLAKDAVQTTPVRLLKILQDSSVQCIEVRAGDTIQEQTGHYFKAQFADLNADGHADVRVFIFSNTPNQCETYFFDTIRKHFRYIEDSDLDFELIKGTNLYYSYCRAGCADLNWVSELGKVEDFKWKVMAYIDGLGCDAPGDTQEIRIYKSGKKSAAEKSLLTVLDYKKNIPENNEKWSFIKRYWQENWKTFAD